MYSSEMKSLLISNHVTFGLLPYSASRLLISLLIWRRASSRVSPLGKMESSKISVSGSRSVSSSRIFPTPFAVHPAASWRRSEEHTSELQSRGHLVCRLLLEKKKHH